jgi:hypothetical protein
MADVNVLLYKPRGGISVPNTTVKHSWTDRPSKKGSTECPEMSVTKYTAFEM